MIDGLFSLSSFSFHPFTRHTSFCETKIAQVLFQLIHIHHQKKTMDTTNAVISLNNEAISLFRSGSEHESVSLLTQSLVNLKTLLSSPQTGSSEITQDSLENGSTSSTIHAINWMCNEAESLPTLAPTCNFVYNKVFKLSRVLEQGCNAADCSQVFAACIIYNLAVIHHNKGLRGRDSVCMEKAVKLYQMCIRIVTNGSFDRFGIVQLLKAVALNNLSQLHLDFSDFQEARACLASLGSLLSSSDLTGSLSMDEYDGIIANVVFLKPSVVAPAA